MQITSNVFQVGGSRESAPSDASIYLIKSGSEAALVDAGTGKGINPVIDNIHAAAVNLEDIKYIFITHCHYDHTGGINELREKTGARVVAHELAAEFLESGDSDVTAASWYGTCMEPTKVDETVQGKQSRFKVGTIDIEFYHTPGHSPGSSVLTLESDGLLVLFGQDVHGPLNDLLRSSRKEYVTSLEFMLSLNADILCEGHFGVYKGKEIVEEFIESFL
ncbi:MAG: MBL fold metallo-hydrolase [bacterium]|nr:MBL fold metallo-hydrolase [bacterium]